MTWFNIRDFWSGTGIHGPLVWEFNHFIIFVLFYSYLERIQTRGNGPNLCIPIGYQNTMGKYHGFLTIWSILNLSGHFGPRDFLEIFMKFRKNANFLGMQLSCGQSQVVDHFSRILSRQSPVTSFNPIWPLQNINWPLRVVFPKGVK